MFITDFLNRIFLTWGKFCQRSFSTGFIFSRAAVDINLFNGAVCDFECWHFNTPFYLTIFTKNGLTVLSNTVFKLEGMKDSWQRHHPSELSQDNGIVALMRTGIGLGIFV